MNLNCTKTEGTCLSPELAAAETPSMVISEFHLRIGSNSLSQLSIHNQGKQALLRYCSNKILNFHPSLRQLVQWQFC